MCSSCNACTRAAWDDFHVRLCILVLAFVRINTTYIKKVFGKKGARLAAGVHDLSANSSRFSWFAISACRSAFSLYLNDPAPAAYPAKSLG